MQFFRFLFSKVFYKNLLWAVGVLVFFFVGFQYGMRNYTHHNQYLIVPNIAQLGLDEFPKILEAHQLRFEIIDSSKYTAKQAPLSVISYSPAAGEEVKVNRKIYITLNPSGYRNVTLPNLIQITRRNAESMLQSVGFTVGSITYEDNIGKDMVLGMTHKGKPISPGTQLPKTATIDLILGNGKR
ncbi:MAG: PASTA domain-containing protein [Flavobacteriaceae bacterium]